jgi:MSHA biogenesis protein MshE
VVKLLNTVFEEALKLRASDIHIEPQEKSLVIRFRIDGVLHVQTEADGKISTALVLRLKLMSGLDISEKRLPQDGRFNIKLRSTSIDIRISSMPTQHGESVVMRLLAQNTGLLQLDRLYMPPRVLERFRHSIARPSGIVLVTGPTGSGKTTTLYAALNELNTPEKKIITVEDPVEYRLPGLNQVQVHEKIDLSFSRVLRSALRQDPDIILLGEMRDQETAEIGMRAATPTTPCRRRSACSTWAYRATWLPFRSRWCWHSAWCVSPARIAPPPTRRRRTSTCGSRRNSAIGSTPSRTGAVRAAATAPTQGIRGVRRCMRSST